MPKSEIAKRDFYDVWLPDLSPSLALVKLAQAAQHDEDDKAWQAFKRRFRGEMGKPEAARLLDLLAALSHQTDLALGCYCEVEAHCHRAVLRELLVERGADLAYHRTG